MKKLLALILPAALIFTLSACWDGDPQIDVSEPISKFFASATVPEFQECDPQDRDKLSRAERALVLPSADCADGQCVVSGRGYPTKDEPFYIARLSDPGSCTLEEVSPVQFKESFSVEVTMNRDYLRSLDLSNSEIEGLIGRSGMRVVYKARDHLCCPGARPRPFLDVD